MARSEGTNPRLEVTLVVHRDAEADVLEAYRWYESKGFGLGAIFVSEVDETLARIESSPMSFAISYGEMRRAVLKRFPYVVYFRDADDVVQVFGVLHGRRNVRLVRARDAR